MSEQHRPDVDLRRLLGEAPVADAVRDRVVDAVLGGSKRRALGAPTRALRFAVVALGVVLVSALALWLAQPGEGPHTGAGVGKTARRPAQVSPRLGTRWQARRGALQERLGAHRLALSAGCDLRFVGGTASAPMLELRAGMATFEVEPLSSGSFVVLTKHAKVTVLGTRFSVKLDAQCTSVHVHRGRVRVDSRAGTGARQEAVTLVRGGDHVSCDRSWGRDNQLDSDGRGVLEAMKLVGSGQRLDHAEQLLASYLARKPNGSYAEEALFFLVLTKDKLGKGAEAKKLAKTFLERFAGSSRAERLRTWIKK